MITEIQDNHVVFLQTIANTGHFVIGRVHLHLCRGEFIRTLHDQAVHVGTMLIQTLDWDLQRFIDLFDKNLHLGSHPRPNIFWWVDDFDNGGIFFDR